MLGLFALTQGLRIPQSAFSQIKILYKADRLFFNAMAYCVQALLGTL